MKHKTPYKRIALAFSLCALIVWGILGTGASLAWFADVSTELNNIFHFADFELKVSHLDENGDWEEIRADTKIFDEKALFEPGYVQVVYLKVENKGEVPFDFYTAVNVNGCSVATNVFGGELLLQDYLKFGVMTGISKEEAENNALLRDTAKENARVLLKDIANMPLHNYAVQSARLEAGGEAYIALIVRMPEEIGNEANYIGDVIPKAELGVTVKAEQIIT